MKWVIKYFDELNTKELYEILKVRSEVFIVEQTCPYQDVDCKDLKSFHLFAQENQEIIAYLRILPKGISYNEVSIGRVLTKLSYRKTGLGKELLRKAIAFIENDMHEYEIRISAQAYLMHFYESFGFKAVSDIYLEDDIEHIEMLYQKEEFKHE